MSRLRADERGFTLIEVLLVVRRSSLVVLGATLTAFDAFTTSHRRDREADRSGRGARRVATRTSRRASCATWPTRPSQRRRRSTARCPTTSSSRPPTRAKTWVRYCLDRRRRRLARTRPRDVGVRERDRDAPSAGMRGPARARAGPRARIVTDQGLQPGQRRRPPDLRLRVRRRRARGCPARAADYPRITNVGARALRRRQPRRRAPARCASRRAVFLRNQNEPPAASCDRRRGTATSR